MPTSASRGELLGPALAWHADGPPSPLVRGDELARELGQLPRPALGGAAGGAAARPSTRARSRTREQALAHARASSRRAGAVARPAHALKSAPCVIRSASSAGSWPASSPRRSSPPMSTRSRSWTSTRPRAGTSWSCRAATRRICSSVDSEELAAVAVAAQRMAALASERLGADGVNLINSCGAAAWQTVFHFHVHVIPRYAGDPLRLPWIPGARRRGRDRADRARADRLSAAQLLLQAAPRCAPASRLHVQAPLAASSPAACQVSPRRLAGEARKSPAVSATRRPRRVLGTLAAAARPVRPARGDAPCVAKRVQLAA